MALDQQAKNEIVVSAVLFALTTATIALRFVTRRVLRSSLIASDWLTGISWLTLTALIIQIFIWATIGGNGEDIKSVSSSKMVVFLKVVLGIALLSNPANNLP